MAWTLRSVFSLKTATYYLDSLPVVTGVQCWVKICGGWECGGKAGIALNPAALKPDFAPLTPSQYRQGLIVFGSSKMLG